MDLMLDLSVDRSAGVPVSTQLALRFRVAVEQGLLKPGDRLPSLRDVAESSGVNVNTVRAVYAKLAVAGVVRTEQGRGTFVTTEPATTSEASVRRALHDEIARLETALVSLPILRGAPRLQGDVRPSRPRLLTVDELSDLRDGLAARVDELRAARGEIVGRLESEEGATVESPSRERRAASRSSSSLAGARVRWTLA